ncbi:hypothetical protein HYPSUDRAFT_185857 [Hypholoma sublateritium FD-334 SS-4]|uniref:Peptidase C14 caspase domain-containing protein n=1 Tax=Hypholoma sublateritium (strain FD-334 SS-4) TaxID=945553 RepID=A0A0D2P267_HYPSF|nr:hypothetical protein HYPSUDRAFT_185857 [Hypholoma sublateritium FD-334 SS-4]
MVCRGSDLRAGLVWIKNKADRGAYPMEVWIPGTLVCSPIHVLNSSSKLHEGAIIFFLPNTFNALILRNFKELLGSPLRPPALHESRPSTVNMNYRYSGPFDTYQPLHQRDDERYSSTEQATFGSSHPPPFPCPQHFHNLLPAFFIISRGASPLSPLSGIGRGFYYLGNYGSYPASPSQFPLPSTDPVPHVPIYGAAMSMPEPHLPLGLGLYAPVSFMHEQPSIIPEHPVYDQQQYYSQQHIWGQGNHYAYQPPIHLDDRYAPPAEYDASVPQGSWGLRVRIPEEGHSGSHEPGPSLNGRGHMRLEIPQNMAYRFHSTYGGIKKALLIGINYIGQPHELDGCINDVLRTREFLIDHGGYCESNIVLLTDDSPQPEKRPTRDNIIYHMKKLVAFAEKYDTLFFQFSGHGGQTPDEDGDEDDGMDETIKPLDYEERGEIVDDELHQILVEKLPEGCRLTALVDACHSGTVLGLYFCILINGLTKDLSVLHDIDLPYMYCSDTSTQSIRLKISERGRHKETRSDVILFAGCLDSETGQDTRENGLAVGAMSWAFTDTLSKFIYFLHGVIGLLIRFDSGKPQIELPGAI